MEPNILIGGIASNHGKSRGSTIKPCLRWKRYCKGNRRVTFRAFVRVLEANGELRREQVVVAARASRFVLKTILQFELGV